MNTYFVDLGLDSDILVYAKSFNTSSNGKNYLFWGENDINAAFSVNLVKKIERQFWNTDGHITYENCLEK